MARLLLAAIAAGLLAGCGGAVQGSGNVVTVSRDVAAFDRISLDGAAAVHVSVGGARAVSVSAEDNIVPRVRTDVRDGVLRIWEKGSIHTHSGITVEVSVPNLSGTTLKGAGSLGASGIQATAFDASLGGAGTLDLDGTAGSLHLDLTGVGDARLEHLRTKDVDVTLSGVGSAHVYATDTLHADVKGVGSVRYRGEPRRIEENVTGVGSVGRE